ncbi:hypothetical protein TSOC_001501 [Tetrabaena socialis]|uniref:Sugar phosphate phosphatase n=1 Tax=Tetrabaena socialis TaxID=47790 RepID=A0A2J8AGJ4_9CHLO|nr:hypothetical protein TSOC_001501 [Tetrabaena socialis]|eukprot:PNH11643.1 hypothetical protein TSOC_001501 [Tetrabaena socialis]
MAAAAAAAVQPASEACAADAAGAALAARLRSGDTSGLPPPPYPPLRGSEPGSFAHGTITARLPAILASMLADLEAEGWGGTPGGEQAAAAVAEMVALREAMLADAALEALRVDGAGPQTQVLLESANACVELATSRQQQQQQQQQHDGGGGGSAARATWLGLPWLLVECYMYAAIHAAMQAGGDRQPALAAHDPFARQKAAGWVKSAAAAAELAEETELLLNMLASPNLPAGPGLASTGAVGAVVPAAAAAAACRTALAAGLLMSLWGNKADLSLLVNAAALDGAALSSAEERGGGGASAGGGGGGGGDGVPPLSRVIVDDSEEVLAALAGLMARRAEAAASGGGGGGGVRVDIVLDNSGLELFADLCLADLLLEAGAADRVALHGKPIPWFVSDTLAADLEALLASCEAEAPPQGAQVSASAWQPVRRLAGRWRAHLAAGRWTWAAHPFWCTPAPFCWMAAAAPDLYGSLYGSGLVVLKGDLNYRKLTHDCRWPHTTPFRTALQGFGPAPLVALRTLKADVAVGLQPGQSQALDAEDPNWLVNGKWGMVQAAL